MANRVVRTEHAGAKNGRGFYGYRSEAKKMSKKRRRLNDRRAVEAGSRDS